MPLLLDQNSSDSRMAAHRTDLAADFRRPDLFSYIFALEKDPVAPLCTLQTDDRILSQGTHFFAIANRDAFSERSQRNGSVHCARIQMQVTKPLGDEFRRCAFPRGRRPVDRYDDFSQIFEL
jgi:hypothetical protein